MQWLLVLTGSHPPQTNSMYNDIICESRVTGNQDRVVRDTSRMNDNEDINTEPK